MEKIYKTAVIGGGAGGLACGVMLARVFGGDTVILERLPRVGKKLAATGNGRGNVTNTRLSPSAYHSQEGDAQAFVAPALAAFGSGDTRAFLRSLGMLTVEEEGRVYPASLQASSVVDLMRLAFAGLGGVLRTEFFVSSIIRDKGVFVISNGTESVLAQTVVLATGGRCHKEFGTDGNGFALARAFGHTATALTPCLVQLKTETSALRSLRGTRHVARITLYDKNRPITCEKGDILFTDFGVSGDAVFKISSYAAGLENAELSVEFLPDISAETVRSLLEEKIRSNSYLTADDLLTGVVNRRLGMAIVASVGLRSGEKCPFSHINAVVSRLKDFRIKMVGSLGFDMAQVTRGGVRLGEIDPHTMRSRLEDGLYLIGEIADVDGDCGGYNLQWAFSSAHLAAMDIKRRFDGEEEGTL